MIRATDNCDKPVIIEGESGPIELPGEATALPSRPERSHSLTRRATLTFISNLLSQAARFIVGFVITPVLIHGLGDRLNGAWVMIQQTAGYLLLGSLRPMGTLKFTLAVTQHVDDVQVKRRQVGAAVALWAASLPVMAALSTVAIWAAPWFIRVEPDEVWMVRLAMGFVVAGLVLDRIVSLPGNVLTGTNQEYKRMGLTAIAILLTGLAPVPALWLGWGLPGVAAATVVAGVLFGMVQYWIARKAVPWLGIAWPGWKEFWRFTKLSLWLLVSAFAFLLLDATDSLLVGFLLGPAAATYYWTTGAVMRFSSGPLVQLLTSGNAGMGGLCGSQQWDRVARLRFEMHLLTVSVLAVTATGVVALNGPFVALWIGPEYYVGYATNLCLVIAAALTVLIRVDGAILDAALAFRLRTFANALAGLVVVGGGFLLCPRYGPLGMALALLLGKLAVTVFQHIYLAHFLRQRAKDHSSAVASHWRHVLVAGLLVGAAACAAPYLQASTWTVFAAEAAAIGLAAAGLYWCIGLDRTTRRLLTHRIPTLRRSA